MHWEPISTKQNLKFRHILSLFASECIAPGITGIPHTLNASEYFFSPIIDSFWRTQNTAGSCVSKSPPCCNSILCFWSRPTPTCDVICPPTTISCAVDPNDVVFAGHDACVWSSKINIWLVRDPRSVCKQERKSIFTYHSIFVQLSSVKVFPVWIIFSHCFITRSITPTPANARLEF